MRGDLDLYFHQSIFLLSEGNLVDLDLGVLGVSAFSAQTGTTGPRPVLPLDSKPVVPRPPGSFQDLVLVSGGAFSPALPGPPGTTAASRQVKGGTTAPAQ